MGVAVASCSVFADDGEVEGLCLGAYDVAGLVLSVWVYDYQVSRSHVRCHGVVVEPHGEGVGAKVGVLGHVDGYVVFSDVIVCVFYFFHWVERRCFVQDGDESQLLE